VFKHLPGTTTLKPKSLKSVLGISLQEAVLQYTEAKQRKGRLDKLGQLVTPLISNTLEKRAKTKHFGTKMAISLANLESPLKKGYWSTYHCSEVIKIEGQKAVSKFCDRRWCPTCSRIRTGKMLNRFLPVFETEFKDPYFVTLTTPNVKGIYLKSDVDYYLKTYGNLVRTIKQGLKRKGQKPQDFKSVKKLEITWNNRTDTYHPHLHILVNSKTQAEEIRRLWLRSNTDAVMDAQNIKQADQGSLKELFKYITKLTYNDPISGKKVLYPTKVLDTIFQSIHGRRTFETYNIPDVINEENKIPSTENLEDITPQEPKTYIYETVPYWNWYEINLGTPLTNYQDQKEIDQIFLRQKILSG
jgi:plasmid rolling circle replication initiator protein Rep